MNTLLREDKGMALVFVTFVIIAVLGALSTLAIYVNQNKRMTDNGVDQNLLDEVCRAGVEFGISRVWAEYWTTGGGNTTGNMASYRVFIENLVPNNEDLNGDGGQNAGETDANGNGEFEVAEPVALVTPDEPVPVGRGRVTSVQLSRTDDLTGTDLVLTVTGELGGFSQTVVQRVRVGGELFRGFEYAVLANNINCILCHAEFRALDLERNTDSDQYGSFDRIKVATLESLLVRLNEAYSNIAGTLYTRGDLMDQSGRAVSANALATSRLQSYEFDDVDGKLVQDGDGGMSRTPLVNADADGEGLLERFANFYKDYPTDEEQMTDGILPEYFPAPYVDDNENRMVDDDEFDGVVATSEGSITGGVIYGLRDGEFYGDSSLPAASNTAQAEIASGNYNGNLFLVGTEDDPIVIDGTVTINGDLVMKGPVKGRGQLLVRRNSYVVGDVVYADADGVFGQAEDGTENALALVSGSTLIGDYLTIRGKNPSSMESQKYPDKRYSIQVREENREQIVNGELLQYGYFDPGSSDAGEYSETMLDADGNEVARQGQQFSFTTSELMLFNRMELQKAVEDSSYKPRFYGLRESQPNSLYVYDSADEHSVRYSEGGVKLLSDYLIEQGLPLSIMDNAAVHYMNPESNWISEDQLRQVWWDDEMSRSKSDGSYDPFRFDGLLYSNNAIFAITRSDSRHGSATGGKMHLRGGVVSPDLGVLVPGNGSDRGLTLEYDRRVKDFLRIENPTEVTFTRQVFSRVS